jgi:hypothetical protein
MKYVGLTDNPSRRKAEHGNPVDWTQKQFSYETEARLWEKQMLSNSGYTGGTGGNGWKYGYIYTVTPFTVQ